MSCENNILTHHGWGGGLEAPFEEDSPVDKLKFTDFLMSCNKSNLLKLDYSKVQEIKSAHRGKILGDDSTTKDINYFRSLINLGGEGKHPIFSVSNQTGLEKIIEILPQEEILEYFPFSSKFDLEFLNEVFKEKFGD